MVHQQSPQHQRHIVNISGMNEYLVLIFTVKTEYIQQTFIELSCQICIVWKYKELLQKFKDN